MRAWTEESSAVAELSLSKSRRPAKTSGILPCGTAGQARREPLAELRPVELSVLVPRSTEGSMQRARRSHVQLRSGVLQASPCPTLQSIAS